MVVGGGGGVADVGGAGGARDGDVKDGLGLVDVRVGDDFFFGRIFLLFSGRILDGWRCMKKKSFSTRKRGHYCKLLCNTPLPGPLYCLQYCASPRPPLLQ